MSLHSCVRELEWLQMHVYLCPGRTLCMAITVLPASKWFIRQHACWRRRVCLGALCSLVCRLRWTLGSSLHQGSNDAQCLSLSMLHVQPAVNTVTPGTHAAGCKASVTAHTGGCYCAYRESEMVRMLHGLPAPLAAFLNGSRGRSAQSCRARSAG